MVIITVLQWFLGTEFKVSRFDTDELIMDIPSVVPQCFPYAPLDKLT